MTETKDYKINEGFFLQPWEVLIKDIECGIPSSPESEVSVITNVLRNPKLLKEIQYLKYEHFQTIEFKILYHAIKLVEKDNIEIDIVSIGEKLLLLKDNIVEKSGENIFNKTREKLIDTNNISLLERYEDTNAVRIKYYADTIIKNYSTKKFLSKFKPHYEDIITHLRDISDIVPDIIDDCNTLLEYLPKTEHDLSKKCDNSLECIDGSLILRSGLGFGDKEIKFIRKRINTLGGLPGHMKTTIMVQMLINSCEINEKVIIFSLEMPTSDLIIKIVCNIARLSFQKTVEGRLTVEELRLYNETLNYIKTKYKDKLYIFDDIFDINKIIQIISQINPDKVFIDYFQLLGEDQRNLRSELNEVLIRLGRFVKFSTCALVLLSQIIRGTEDRQDSIPRNSDLAETARLERDSSTITFTYYDWIKHFSDKLVSCKYGRLRYGSNILIISKTKGRYSPPFMTKLNVEPDFGRIRTMTQDEWKELIDAEKEAKGIESK